MTTEEIMQSSPVYMRPHILGDTYGSSKLTIEDVWAVSKKVEVELGKPFTLTGEFRPPMKGEWYISTSRCGSYLFLIKQCQVEHAMPHLIVREPKKVTKYRLLSDVPVGIKDGQLYATSMYSWGCTNTPSDCIGKFIDDPDIPGQLLGFPIEAYEAW